MMNFPSTPTVGQQYSSDGRTWEWTGVAWRLIPISDLQVQRAETASIAAGQSASAAAQSAIDAAANVLSRVLTGLSTATNAVITAGDTVLGAFGKLQAQFTAHFSNTSNPHSVTKAQVGLGSVDNTADTAKPVSTAQQTALNLKANIASPTFTGTVGGITKAMVGLGNVDNTADTAKPVSTAQQAALDLKAPLASPTFTGTVAGVTKAMVGLGNVDNTADSAKPVSTAQQTALNLKANLASPTFTGTVSGITATMVGLGNVNNTADSAKPVSTAQQAAIDAANQRLVSNLQTGTAYTLALADAGKRVGMSNASANTVTVPPNSTAAFPVDSTIFISQDGDGATSIAAGAGVTINVAEGLKVGGKYRMVSLVKTATDTWMGIGTVA